LSTQKFSYTKFLIQYVSWWTGWIALQTLVLYYTTDLDLTILFKDSLVTNAVLGLAGIELMIVMRHYQPRQFLRFVWSVVLAVGCTAIVRWILSGWMSDEPEYLRLLDQWIVVRAVFAWLLISFITVASWLWFSMMEQQELQLRQSDTETLAREAELTALRQQLQPHFLFNSLNSISALAGSRPEEARKMIQQLSDFLRGTIKRDNQSVIALQEELHLLELYLDIEKVRFGHRLSTETIISDEATAMKLPPLLLQPIVENAIKFGLYDTTGDITIRVSAKGEHSYLAIQVENPYDPQTSQPKQGTGFGLSSIQRRLYLLFGRNDLLTTRQSGTTFTTEVRIPQTL
jgi:two-component system, LytTR family, sensor kinase